MLNQTTPDKPTRLSTNTETAMQCFLNDPNDGHLRLHHCEKRWVAPLYFSTISKILKKASWWKEPKVIGCSNLFCHHHTIQLHCIESEWVAQFNFATISNTLKKVSGATALHWWKEGKSDWVFQSLLSYSPMHCDPIALQCSTKESKNSSKCTPGLGTLCRKEGEREWKCWMLSKSKKSPRLLLRLNWQIWCMCTKL